MDQQFRSTAEALLRAARAGSSEALGQLLDQCRRYLLAVANAEMDADLQIKASPSDIVQDTLLEGVRQFTRFTGQSAEELRLWLVAIFRNKLSNLRQRYRTSKREIGREFPLDAEASQTPLRDLLPDDTPPPHVVAAADEQTQALLAAVSRLPEVQRQVVRWRNWEQLSFAEIGTRLGRSADAARMVWSRAVERLGEELIPSEG